MLDVVQIPLGPYRTNCYLVAREGASEAVVIDPGDDSGTVLSVLADRGWTPTAVLVTHGHSDHLGAVRDVAEASGIEVWIPHDEADDLRTLHPGAYEPEHLLEGGNDPLEALVIDLAVSHCQPTSATQSIWTRTSSVPGSAARNLTPQLVRTGRGALKRRAYAASMASTSAGSVYMIWVRITCSSELPHSSRIAFRLLIA